MMAVSDLEKWASHLMGPTPIAIFVTIVLVLSIPLFLHLVIYRSANSSSLPTILLLGPSGAGKTSLLTLVSMSWPWSYITQ